MTTFRSTETVAAESVTAAIAAVRSHGLRVSTSRRMVLEALFSAEAPVSAERIATGLGGQLPPLDLASVYRNLDTLEQLGVVRHFHAGHGPGLYALAGRELCEYLVCDGCGAVRAVDPQALDPVRAALREGTGWGARFTHFPVVGTCPDCTERSA
jgi:Fur family ferric uptake transcriptional regulator